MSVTHKQCAPENVTSSILKAVELVVKDMKWQIGKTTRRPCKRKINEMNKAWGENNMVDFKECTTRWEIVYEPKPELNQS